MNFKCPTASSARVPKCPSALSARELKYPLSAQMPQVLASRSPWVSTCAWNALRVPIEWLSALWVTHEMSALWVPKCPLSALLVKKVCSITGNGLHNSFIESFKNLSEYMFCIIVIVFCFLGNKICKFCHVLLVRYKSLKELSKTFVKYFWTSELSS